MAPLTFADTHNMVAFLSKSDASKGNQLNDHAGINENLDACKVKKETVSAQQYVMLPLWSTGSQDLQNINDVVDVAFDVKENEYYVHIVKSRRRIVSPYMEKASWNVVVCVGAA
nr:hypothetical protein [Tanacetum cinerariifolium]